MPRYTNEMVAHVWAQREKPYGESHNGQFYFSGATLYSYGSHFIVGKFVDVPTKRGPARRAELGAKYPRASTHYPYASTGDVTPVAGFSGDPLPESVALMNSDSYSVTTSRHQSLARSALAENVETFTVPRPGLIGENVGAGAANKEAHAANIDHFNRRTRFAINQASKRKNAGRYTKEEKVRRDIEAARVFVATARRYAAIFALDQRRIFDPFADGADGLAEILEKARRDTERENAKRKRERARARREQEKAQRARELELSEALDEWTHNGGAPRYGFTSEEVRLRISGDELQTSHGARVPLAHARRAWPRVQEAHARAVRTGERQALGYSVGHFRLDSVSQDGYVTAGCHLIPIQEASRILDAEPVTI